ncbi:DUF2306 domain-containing protein [Stagnihabitans tardus]|uniref:DUF2306 domain-containing protein n=1 Tax=Stagnihabitans tardus TaxID=2699202 RepID=A0AAE4Y7L5_9RHOB|nr:DUF2306 domain-containing protein [Stagnihabitans tardus]NBZ86634.1 DUF2306 domain-containing protein [Stagnihabitans tardus]
MTLAPLLQAEPAVQLHAFPAIAAFFLGLVQLALSKGGARHRLLGWLWVLLMALIAGSSFFIHSICLVGGFSPIHLLSVLTLVSLPFAVLHARHGRITAHAKGMKMLFFTALVLAGVFTFLPGRIMHDVTFGTALATPACAP